MIDIFKFQEPIGVFDDELLDIKTNLDLLYALKTSQSDSDHCSNLNGWQKQLDANDFNGFVEVINHHFNFYIREALGPYRTTIVPSVRFKNLFCNINEPGSSNVIHDHSGSHFSGVYWLDASERSGDLFLLSPFRSSFLNHTEFAGKAVKLRRDVERNHNSIRIKPCKQTGVFFNSSIVHYTDINRSDSDRVSIAFNLDLL